MGSKYGEARKKYYRDFQYFHCLNNFFTETVCPRGWQLHDQSCVQVQNASMTFDLAKAGGCLEGTFLEDLSFGFWTEVTFGSSQIFLVWSKLGEKPSMVHGL